jgi:tetratricopeptide (TPR) repeat protein
MMFLLCLSIAAIVVAPVRAQGNAGAAVVEKAPAPAAAVDSLPLFEQAVAKDSTGFDNLYRLGVMYLDRDKVGEAIKVLTKAHVLRPKDHRVSVNLGVANDAAGRADAAQAYYREVLAAFPDDSVASCRLASSLYSQARHAEAMALLQETIKKAPRAYCAYFTLGVAFADAGIYKDAIRMWRKVVEIAPASPEAISARESIEVLEKFVFQ